jgi:hypothetical protein
MADSSDSSDSSLDVEAELRISRVRALNDKDLMAVVTYLLARHPDTFPAMLDDALSSVSPKDRGEPRRPPRQRLLG